MARGEPNQSDQLAQAVHEVAAAIRSQQKEQQLHNRNERNAENRRVLAEQIMSWANLEFGGLVIAQVFSEAFNQTLALIGIGLFIGAYLVALRIMKGGDF